MSHLSIAVAALEDIQALAQSIRIPAQNEVQLANRLMKIEGTANMALRQMERLTRKK